MEKIRILIAILGMDQHEVGAIAISRSLRDAGMEVIYAGRFNLPPMILKIAMEEDVHVIGLSCHSWEYLYYVDELLQLLKEKNLRIPIVMGGSVITPWDEKMLVGRPTQRFLRQSHLLLAQRRAVRAGRVLLVGAAISDVGAADDERRSLGLLLGGAGGRVDLVYIVSIHLLHIPITSAETCAHVFGERQICGAFDRDVVVVVKADQFPQP